jgi:hypothetical protein
VRTRSCGSSSTDYAGTSSWILRIAISILQYLRRGIANVLAMATVVDVELAVCSCRSCGSSWNLRDCGISE